MNDSKRVLLGRRLSGASFAGGMMPLVAYAVLMGPWSGYAQALVWMHYWFWFMVWSFTMIIVAAVGRDFAQKSRASSLAVVFNIVVVVIVFSWIPDV
jgi:hypothetical protein